MAIKLFLAPCEIDYFLDWGGGGCHTVAGWLCFPGMAKSIFAPYLYIVVIFKHVFLEEKSILSNLNSKFHE